LICLEYKVRGFFQSIWICSLQLMQEVAENVLSFDTPFWLRLATRADMCSSLDDKKDYEELASQIMAIVELLVQKTKEKIESSTDVLKSIIAPLIDSDEEIVWPPRNPQAFADMRKEVDKRDKGNYLDESFLSEVSAQLRQVCKSKAVECSLLLSTNVTQ
jgi:hypothetical protein